MRNPIMIGERVYLRPFETSDAEQIARDDAAETETFFDNGRVPTSPIAQEHWITELHKQQPPEGVSFAVCLKENDRVIGMMELYAIDYVNRTAETGSWLNATEYRGQGYGPEAKQLLLEYAFDRLQLEVLSSFVWAANTRSAAAVRRQGYREAGRLKTTATKNWKPVEEIVFDLKRDEWLAAREEWRARLAERR